MKEYKVILSAKVARILLRQNFTIVDVKANKENKEKTVFVFKNSEALEKALREIIKENQLKEGERYNEEVKENQS